MSLGAPGPGCLDLAFQAAYALSESAEMALEDYARALLSCRAAEALHGGDEPVRVRGVHVCGMDGPAGSAALADLEGFAREMAERAGGGGLGWS